MLETTKAHLIGKVARATRMPDYLQIFYEDGRILNVFNSHNLDADFEKMAGWTVADVSQNPNSLALVFSNGNVLTIGLQDSDYNGPEALELVLNAGSRIVWP